MTTFITILASLFGAVLIYLSIFKWNILRDAPKDDNDSSTKPPYSLSRVQMMWWLSIIFASFIIIMHRLGWRVDDTTIIFSDTALILLGIGTGTTVVSQGIDQSKKDKPQTSKGEAKNLFQDVVSNKNGITVTRLQQLLFTAVFGIIFISECARCSVLEMPDFADQWMVVLGLSAGGYVVNKASERL